MKDKRTGEEREKRARKSDRNNINQSDRDGNELLRNTGLFYRNICYNKFYRMRYLWSLSDRNLLAPHAQAHK